MKEASSGRIPFPSELSPGHCPSPECGHHTCGDCRWSTGGLSTLALRAEELAKRTRPQELAQRTVCLRSHRRCNRSSRAARTDGTTDGSLQGRTTAGAAARRASPFRVLGPRRVQIPELHPCSIRLVCATGLSQVADGYCGDRRLVCARCLTRHTPRARQNPQSLRESTRAAHVATRKPTQRKQTGFEIETSSANETYARHSLPTQ